MALRCLLPFILGAVWSSCGEGQTVNVSSLAGLPWELRLAGVCDNNLHLDGLSFFLQGRTKNGAPYWKGVVARDNRSYYIYYDEDCDGNSDGEPRWIIDKDAPRLDVLFDLDGDRGCDYLGRLDSFDKSRPPMQATWHLQCGLGEVKEWRDHFIIMLAFTSTTTIPRATTMPPGGGSSWSSSAPGDNATSAPAMLRLDGACPYKANLSGLTYVLEGRTASGAPYYKAQGAQEYLYYDADCDGAGPDRSAKWILDQDRPSLQAIMDLDGDGQCNYHARTLTDGQVAARPPTTATWKMYCGGVQGFQDLTLTLQPVDGKKNLPVSSAPTGGRLVVPALAAVAALSSVAAVLMEL